MEDKELTTPEKTDIVDAKTHTIDKEMDELHARMIRMEQEQLYYLGVRVNYLSTLSERIKTMKQVIDQQEVKLKAASDTTMDIVPSANPYLTVTMKTLSSLCVGWFTQESLRRLYPYGKGHDLAVGIIIAITWMGVSVPSYFTK